MQRGKTGICDAITALQCARWRVADYRVQSCTDSEAATSTCHPGSAKRTFDSCYRQGIASEAAVRHVPEPLQVNERHSGCSLACFDVVGSAELFGGSVRQRAAERSFTPLNRRYRAHLVATTRVYVCKPSRTVLKVSSILWEYAAPPARLDRRATARSHGMWRRLELLGCVAPNRRCRCIYLASS